MKSITKLVFVAAVLGIMLYACNKKNNSNTGTTASLVSDQENVQMVATSDQIDADIEQAYDDGLSSIDGGSAKSPNTNTSAAPTGGIVFGSCVTVTFVHDANMDTLTINYGTTGCVCNDGKTRKGMLIATATHFDSLGVVRTLTTQNYYVNNYQVQGTLLRTITKNIDSAMREATIVENLTITNPGDTLTYSRSGNITRIFDLGNLGTAMDNTMTTWGQINIQRPNGNQISRTVDSATALFYKNSCHQFVSGIANIVTNNNNITINYGNGGCDGTATVTDGNKTWTINL